MELQQAIALIRHPGLIKNKTTTWADLGCGTGLFTRALAPFLQPGSLVYAVDSNRNSLSRMEVPPNDIRLEKVHADFVRDDLPFHELDGILMANALHFVRDKSSFLKKADRWLQPEGCFLLVEYDTDKANPWVPYPISFSVLQQLVAELGYHSVEQLGKRPSIYHRAAIYAALFKR
jgi:ubiquinone/menaquinone biosynthesis C-methylase UbiE